MVSSRTFFNYYASKTAAMFGIPNLAVTETQRAEFLSGTGPVLDDLCALVSAIAEDRATTHKERSRVKQLLSDDPEVGYEMFSAMRTLRCELRDLVMQRVDPREGSIVAALVFAALPLTYMTDESGSGPESLRATISEMCEVGQPEAS